MVLIKADRLYNDFKGLEKQKIEKARRNQKNQKSEESRKGVENDVGRKFEYAQKCKGLNSGAGCGGSWNFQTVLCKMGAGGYRTGC